MVRSRIHFQSQQLPSIWQIINEFSGVVLYWLRGREKIYPLDKTHYTPIFVAVRKT
jgi:hypothetical protein